MLATKMRLGRTWPWIRMRPFLAQFSEPVWSGHLPSWADFITTTPVLRFSVHTTEVDEATIGSALTRSARVNSCKSDAYGSRGERSPQSYQHGAVQPAEGTE